MQYSQYKGAILATPQKSLTGSQPVATIGGEPAGRGAIVVQDDLGQAPNVQGEQTSMDAGKAEPGRDIFAQSPQGEVKSENKVVLSPSGDNEPKAISSIGLTSHGDVLSKQDEIALERPAESASSISQQDGSPSSSAEASSPASSEGAKAKVQGPLDAEQAEADEVRQELFPDANT
jgi:dolichyl-phosphate-mannose-protein mannosyltransferase